MLDKIFEMVILGVDVDNMLSDLEFYVDIQGGKNLSQ